MTLSSALTVALAGLQTSSTLLQLTSSNISNAQTPGYTEKSAQVSTNAIGNPEISSYIRATNTVLQQSFNAATSSSSYLGTQNKYMKQVQTILNSTTNPPALSSAMSQFAAAWTQLQSSPEDPTVQQAVVQVGVNLAQQINNISDQTLKLQTQVQTDVQNTVTQLNNDLTTIANLNQQIFTANSENQPVGGLQDQLDQAVNQISSIANVQVFMRNNGQVAIYTSNGTALLDGAPLTFTYNGSTITDSSGSDVTNSLTGGSLQAELQFNATTSPPSSLPGVNTIQKLQGQITDLINAFTNGSAFETAYNPGGLAANDFFTNTSGLAVNSSLVSNPTNLSNLTSAEVNNTANTFTTNYNFTDATTGLALNSGTTTSLVNTILSGFQQAANTISTQSQSATQQQTYYQQTLSNATGVNVDSELVNLTNLQNSYAASAHVISTISQMFNDLMGSV